MSPVPHEEDPWTKVTTASGLAADEVISTLQKSIRRGDLENAALCAHDLATTSEELEQVLWDRLNVIAVEDVGFADPNAVVIVQSLAAARQPFEPGAHDRFLFAAQAVRYLVEQPKDRSTDEFVNWLKLEVDEGRKPEIFDDALDMHTRRGQEMGRGLKHFLLTASRTTNDSPARVRKWKRLLLERLGVADNDDTQ